LKAIAHEEEHNFEQFTLLQAFVDANPWHFWAYFLIFDRLQRIECRETAYVKEIFEVPNSISRRSLSVKDGRFAHEE